MTEQPSTTTTTRTIGNEMSGTLSTWIKLLLALLCAGGTGSGITYGLLKPPPTVLAVTPAEPLATKASVDALGTQMASMSIQLSSVIANAATKEDLRVMDGRLRAQEAQASERTEAIRWVKQALESMATNMATREDVRELRAMVQRHVEGTTKP